jgi:general secretion pathway protein K
MADVHDRESGVAIVLVLWMIALLTVLAVSFARDASVQAKIVRNQYDIARAHALADTGVSLAILGILDAAPDDKARLDGSPRDLTYGDGEIVLGLQNEAGKIDLNHASGEVLGNLFRTVGLDAAQAVALVDAVADWKRRRRAVWDSTVNRGRIEPAVTAVGPFLALEEFRAVQGITPEIYARVSPFLTVFSGTERIDALAAPRQVLLSLPGVDPGEVDAYVSARAKFGPDPSLLPALTGVDAYLGPDTVSFVSISSEGRIPPSVRFIRNATISLIVNAGERYRFVSWRQGQNSGK